MIDMAELSAKQVAFERKRESFGKRYEAKKTAGGRFFHRMLHPVLYGAHVERRIAKLELTQRENKLIVILHSVIDEHRLMGSIVRHRLLNTCGGVKTALEVAGSLPPGQEETRKEMLHLAEDSNQQSIMLIRMLAKWDSAGHGTQRDEEIKVRVSAGRVLSALEGNAKQKGITLENGIPDGIAAFADRMMFEDVIWNLAFNAIKFTEEGGMVSLRAFEDGKCLHMTVADNGVGMSRKRASEIFKINNRGSTRGTAGEAGNGLGLSVVQKVIKRHGGEIWAESELGKGTVFHFTLPLPPKKEE